nr:hypothetical protein [uncultured Flavobacterium sp.]
MEKIKERKKQSYDGMFYSIQRIDLLIVSFCGAGIYVCLETIKYFSEKGILAGPLIKICGGFFLIGIILNFLSQHYGYKSNEQDYLMCDAMIDAFDKKTKECKRKELKSEISKYDIQSDKYSNNTKNLNLCSMIAMFVALVLLGIYFSITF